MKTNLIILAGITLIATNSAFAGGQQHQAKQYVQQTVKPVVRQHKQVQPRPVVLVKKQKVKTVQKKIVKKVVKVTKVIKKVVKKPVKVVAHNKARKQAERRLKRANAKAIAAQKARLLAQRKAAHARKLAAQRAQAARRLAAQQAKLKQAKKKKSHSHHQNRQYH